MSDSQTKSKANDYETKSPLENDIYQNSSTCVTSMERGELSKLARINKSDRFFLCIKMDPSKVIGQKWSSSSMR